MKVVPPKPFALPRVDEVPRSVQHEAIGRSLRQLYDGLIAEGVPEHLASLVYRLEAGDQSELFVRHQRVALIVEDEPELCDVAAAMLGETELEVITCSSAEAALAFMQYRGREVAFVFADVRLAGPMSGFDLARSNATLWPKARIVVTSGVAGERGNDLPEGVIFMPKPWRALEVLGEVERAIQSPNKAVR